MSADVLTKVAETFRIFGDETRLRIFQTLEKKERCVSEIAEKVGMSPSAISHQLRILRQADLVRTQKRGKEVYYRIADGHVKCIIDDCLEHVME
jgi:ArsR family transcriptional regulator